MSSYVKVQWSFRTHRKHPGADKAPTTVAEREKSRAKQLMTAAKGQPAKAVTLAKVGFLERDVDET